MVGSRERSETGYVLLGVLWICVGVGALAAAISAAARDAIAASRNRVALTQATWQAEACLALASAVITERLGEPSLRTVDGGSVVWNRADGLLGAHLPSAQRRCQVTAEAVGTRVDVNTADAKTLQRLLRHVGVTARRADSISAHLLAHRPFVDMRQVAVLLQPDSLPAIHEVLDVDAGPVSLNHAPLAVLAVLPGFSAELATRVINDRREGRYLRSFQELPQRISSAARDTLSRASARLPGVVVLEPTAWRLTALSGAGAPPVSVAVEMRMTRLGERVGTTRRRSWVR